MSNLRRGLIRLAHQHPEFREQILPLLKESGTKTSSLIPDPVVNTEFLKRHVQNVYNELGHAVDVVERTGTVDPRAISEGVKALVQFAGVLEDQARAAVEMHAKLKAIAQTAKFHVVQLRNDPTQEALRAAYNWILQD